LEKGRNFGSVSGGSGDEALLKKLLERRLAVRHMGVFPEKKG